MSAALAKAALLRIWPAGAQCEHEDAREAFRHLEALAQPVKLPQAVFLWRRPSTEPKLLREVDVREALNERGIEVLP